jgi:hypothetical protein
MKFLACAVILSCAIALLAGAAPAGVAQASAAPVMTTSVTVGKTTSVTALPVNASPQVRAECGPALNEYDRTAMCWLQAIIFTFFLDGKPVGTTIVGVVQYIHLNAGGKNWTEHDTVTSVVSRGRTAPVEFKMVAICGSPCVASAHFSGIMRVGLLPGHVSYRDDIPNGEFHTTNTVYRLEWSAAPFIPLNIPVWHSIRSYRCDQGVAVSNTGCVISSYVPALLLSQAQYGASAAMILWAQGHMKSRWGVYPNGTKLTRLKSKAQAKKNRDKVCSAFTDIPGIGAPHDGDSCDEFPFAGTNQSGAGALGTRTGAACVQVYAKRTAHTGSEAAQWNDITVQRRPNLRAPCIRGHIPELLNEGAGGAYGAFVQNARLFDGEAFFVIVTT